jgi:hypothetical protein
LWTHLDAIGLPWRETRASLIMRYGVKPHDAFGWEVIEFETATPILSGLLWPLSTQNFPEFSPNVPATDFSGVAYSGEDARKNLHEVVRQLTPILGEGRRTESSNSVGYTWELGVASIDLYAWPADMQRWSMNNPAHARESRLKAGCSVNIKTGLQLQATVVEKGLIRSFKPIARAFDGKHPNLRDFATPVPQSELEYVRLFDNEYSHCRGWVGLSEDESALIFFNHWLYFVPMKDVVGIQLRRLLPAKGPGGAWLGVECRANLPGRPTKTLTIMTARGADDLSESASRIAQVLGKPLVLMPYDYDA